MGFLQMSGLCISLFTHGVPAVAPPLVLIHGNPKLTVLQVKAKVITSGACFLNHSPQVSLEVLGFSGL